MRGTAPQLANENRERAKRIVRQFSQTAQACEIRLHNTAVWKFSMGSVPQAELGKAPPGLNHPYGLGFSNMRGPRGPIPNGGPGVINRQTGEFASSWETWRAFGPGRVTIALFNYSEHAKFMAGTNLMIPRPVLQLIAATEFPLFCLDMESALRRALVP